MFTLGILSDILGTVGKYCGSRIHSQPFQIRIRTRHTIIRICNAVGRTMLVYVCRECVWIEGQENLIYLKALTEIKIYSSSINAAYSLFFASFSDPHCARKLGPGINPKTNTTDPHDYWTNPNYNSWLSVFFTHNNYPYVIKMCTLYNIQYCTVYEQTIVLYFVTLLLCANWSIHGFCILNYMIVFFKLNRTICQKFKIGKQEFCNNRPHLT